MQPDEAGHGCVDVIIVPTVRPAAGLGEAVRLARLNGCVLLVLCSRGAAADEVVSLASYEDVRIIAIDVDLDFHRTLLPDFKSDRLIADSEFKRESDLSFKRNLGMYFALLAGWCRVVFLDDDIVVPEWKDLAKAVGLLEHHRAVGLKVGGCPDNSVVCHANREVGGFQDTYIGGGALAVDVQAVDSFFPDIYNEDWFFLSDVSSAVVGSAIQERYDPFKGPERAEMEEFGDCLAEGIYTLRDLDLSEHVDDRDYWEMFLDDRRCLILAIIDRAEVNPENKPIVASLKAAYTRCEAIDPDFCLRYLEAWRDDRREWLNFLTESLETYDVGADPVTVARYLGIEEVVCTQAPPRAPRRMSRIETIKDFARSSKGLGRMLAGVLGRVKGNPKSSAEEMQDASACAEGEPARPDGTGGHPPPQHRREAHPTARLACMAEAPTGAPSLLQAGDAGEIDCPKVPRLVKIDLGRRLP